MIWRQIHRREHAGAVEEPVRCFSYNFPLSIGGTSNADLHLISQGPAIFGSTSNRRLGLVWNLRRRHFEDVVLQTIERLEE